MKSLSLYLGIVNAIIRRSHPSYLVLFVTSRCNCGCSFCFFRKNIREKTAREELSIQAIDKIARSMRPLPQLLLSGGEPFLRYDIADIVKSFYINSGTRQITIPTNGTIPRQIEQSVTTILAQCPTAYVNINLSVDGIEEDHDLSRGLKGCFKMVCETYRKLEKIRDKENRLSINFLTVIKKDNLEKVLSIIEYIKRNFNANYHSLRLIRGNADENDRVADIKKINSTLDTFYSKKGGVSKLPIFNRVSQSALRRIWDIQLESMQKEERCFRCLAGKKMVVITPHGDLVPCEPLWLEQKACLDKVWGRFIMAHLKEYDYDVQLALESSESKVIKNFIAEKKCWCTYGCAVLNGIMYSPLMYPKLLIKRGISGKTLYQK